MPVFGLAKATQHIAIAGRKNTARGRIKTETSAIEPQLF